MWRDWGNRSINSTSGVAGNPSTSTLLAELDSTRLGTVDFRTGKNFQVSWIVGASTIATYRLEHCLSTGLGSTAIRDVTLVQVPANQSGQYMLSYKLEPNDRLRVRANAGFTGNGVAKIAAEPMG